MKGANNSADGQMAKLLRKDKRNVQGLDVLPSEANRRLSSTLSSSSNGTCAPVSGGHPMFTCMWAMLQKRKRVLVHGRFLDPGKMVLV